VRRAGAPAVLAGALAVAGCGGGTPPQRPPARAVATAAPLEALAGCDRVGSGWRPLRLATDDGTSAATLGRGPLGVVFANESGGSACGWTGLARALAGAGHPVAVTDGPGDARRALAAAVALRVAGARRIVLIGASVGGRAVLQAAALRPDAVVGAVSISGERDVDSDPEDLLPAARHVQLPVLFVGSREDGYTNFGADTRQLHRAVPARVDELLLVSGGDHGVDLLADAHGPRVRAAIARFVGARDR
jgi:pimeloyl-ACP methyl ester carboxylesterase